LCGGSLLVNPPAAAGSFLLRKYSRRARLPADCAAAHQRVDYSVLLGPNLPGTAQRDVIRSYERSRLFCPKKCRPARVVSIDLRDSFLWNRVWRVIFCGRYRLTLGSAFHV